MRPARSFNYNLCFRIRDPVLPSQIQYPSKTAEVEMIESSSLLLVHRPGLRSVRQCRQDDRLVLLQFGVDLETVAIPDCALQTAEGMTHSPSGVEYSSFAEVVVLLCRPAEPRNLALKGVHGATVVCFYEEPSLPRTEGDEFRPFIPRLLEANFWYCATRAVIISILCTFVPFLDIPVFWPILVLYFLMLFTVMMKRQIKHMIKYRYMPFTYGKPSHVSGKKTSNVIVS
ncbi:retention in endoplasmic reticulum protein 1 [Sparganum proliferum]